MVMTLTLGLSRTFISIWVEMAVLKYMIAKAIIIPMAWAMR